MSFLTKRAADVAGKKLGFQSLFLEIKDSAILVARAKSSLFRLHLQETVSRVLNGSRLEWGLSLVLQLVYLEFSLVIRRNFFR